MRYHIYEQLPNEWYKLEKSFDNLEAMYDFISDKNKTGSFAVFDSRESSWFWLTAMKDSYGTLHFKLISINRNPVNYATDNKSDDSTDDEFIAGAV